MLNYLIAGVAAYLAGDYIVHDVTGRHLHEHLFAWWCELKEFLQHWLMANRHLQVRAIGLTVLDALDDVAVQTKQTADKITLGLWGVDAQENGYEIVTRVVSVDEAMRQFPELRQTHTLVEQLAH